MQALMATAPVRPDFHFCDASYSDYRALFNIADCLQAEASMPRGAQALRYHEPDHSYPTFTHYDLEFPLIYRHGTCEIAVEVIDLDDTERPTDDAWFDIAPDIFRSMAGWIIERCVQAEPSVGGFVTRNISHAIDYIQQPQVDFPIPFGDNNWPLNASFFTVSVQAETENADLNFPGRYDPATGGAVFTALYEKLMNMPFDSPTLDRVSRLAEQINVFWGDMGRNGPDNIQPWYGYEEIADLASIPSKDTTSYKCDAKLGRPQHVDCSQLQYSQLSHLDNDLPLDPGLTKFFHSETCNIGISVAEPTTISWKQIKSAIDEIIEACVNNPLKLATGGRAFYGHQSLFDINIAGKKRKRDSGALNALPPAVNVTLFEQYELFKGVPTDKEEMDSCTWRKALQGQDVRPCRSVHHHQHP